MKKLIILFIIVNTCLWGHDGSHKQSPKAVIKANNDIITGNGRFTYDVSTTWGKLPDGEKLGPTHGGIAIDENGLIYISTDGPRSIIVFKSDGTFVGFLAPEARGIHQLTIHKENGEEFLYGAQLNAYGGKGNRKADIVKFNLQGEIVLRITDEDVTGPLKEKFKGFNGITGIAVAPDNSIFVSMGYGSKHVYKLNQQGKILKKFGGKINEHKANPELALSNPHNLAIDNRFETPRLLVVDREKKRLLHYDLEGNFIGVYATNLRRPCAVSFFGGYCAVAELQARVTVLDKQGVPIAFLGDNPNPKQWANFKVLPKDQKHGIFSGPHGLSFDKEGNLYVQDWNIEGRATKLTLKK